MASLNKLYNMRRCIFTLSRSILQYKSQSTLHDTLVNIKSLQHLHSRAIFSGPTLLSLKDNIDEEKSTTKKLKQTGKLAKVFAEYGTTAVIFHTTISLTSLSISYMAVSSGIDVVALLQKFNLITEASTEASIAGGATTFVIAYACHKVFMPVRIFCTVTCTPLIVKKLRSIGLLKTPVEK